MKSPVRYVKIRGGSDHQLLRLWTSTAGQFPCHFHFHLMDIGKTAKDNADNLFTPGAGDTLLTANSLSDLATRIPCWLLHLAYGSSTLAEEECILVSWSRVVLQMTACRVLQASWCRSLHLPCALLYRRIRCLYPSPLNQRISKVRSSRSRIHLTMCIPY